MAESTELSNLKPKSTGCDNDDFEELQGEEVELAKRDATADSTGFGRFLIRGVSGAYSAVASFSGGFGQKSGPEGTAGPGKKEATKVVVREPQSHRQTTAEKQTRPQLLVR